MAKTPIKKEILNTLFLRAKECIKEGERDKARDFADRGLVYVASKRGEGMKVDDLIDDVKIETWLMRFWVFLENNQLLLGEKY